MSGIYEAALDSCRWNSMNPERTAATLENDFSTHLTRVMLALRAAGPDTEKADAEYRAYRDGYERRYRAWLSARGRTASVGVTGAANFPVARNRKRMDTERRRSEELSEWAKKAERAALKRLRPTVDPAQLEALEATLDAMKAANRIVRRKWSDERKVAALVADVGLSEDAARKVLEPDFCGRVGFPPHSLASVRGKIKRARVAA